MLSFSQPLLEKRGFEPTVQLSPTVLVPTHISSLLVVELCSTNHMTYSVPFQITSGSSGIVLLQLALFFCTGLPLSFVQVEPSVEVACPTRQFAPFRPEYHM